jgi:recombination protein RecT
MIQGIQKRVKNTGNIQSWSAALVYANEAKAERFKFWRDDLGLHLVHQPFLPVIDGERGEFVAAYSAVRYRDGTVDYEIMAVDELDRIMDRTKSKDREGNITGPWRDDRAEMQKKTVMRRHAKRLDVSSELRTIIERVDEQYDFKQSPDEVYQMDEAGAPRAVANRRRASAAELLKAAQARQEPEPEGPQHAEHFEGDDDEAPPPAKGKAAPKAKATQQPEPQQQQPEQTGDQVNPADDF